MRIWLMVGILNGCVCLHNVAGYCSQTDEVEQCNTELRILADLTNIIL